jgi:acyl-CoA thioester hydrolase
VSERKFTWPVRVYFEDTDAVGVVYYANYLRFMERARTEWLRALGFELDQLAREQNLAFVVHRANIEFHQPARLDDLLQVSAELGKLGRASLQMAQQVTRDGQLLCSGEIQLATLSADTLRPRAIPDPIKEELVTWKPL